VRVCQCNAITSQTFELRDLTACTELARLLRSSVFCPLRATDTQRPCLSLELSGTKVALALSGQRLLMTTVRLSACRSASQAMACMRQAVPVMLSLDTLTTGIHTKLA